MNRSDNDFIYIYIYSNSTVNIRTNKVKLANLVEGDPKVPFSIATTLK